MFMFNSFSNEQNQPVEKVSESDTKHVCTGFNLIKIYWVIWNISSNHWNYSVNFYSLKDLASNMIPATQPIHY